MGLSCPSISSKSNLNPSIPIPPFLLGSIFTLKTLILGLRLFIVIIATVVLVLTAFILILLLLRQWILKRHCIGVNQSSELLPLVCSESIGGGEADRREVKSEKNRVFVIGGISQGLDAESESKESSMTQSESSSAMSASTNGFGSSRWGRWYSLREMQVATNQFLAQNVIGEGGYGIVYRGVLQDSSVIAVKNLLNNK